MNRGPVPIERQLSVLQSFGLLVTSDAKACCAADAPYVSVLEALGLGSIDEDTEIWIPSSSQVYAFNLATDEIESMYAQLFQGLQSISQGTLTFSDVRQTIHIDQQEPSSGLSWDEFSGAVQVSFHLNGRPCATTLSFLGTCIDLRILDAVNHCLEKLGIQKRFYSTPGSQGNIVFFCTASWAKRFEEATLCPMDTKGISSFPRN